MRHFCRLSCGAILILILFFSCASNSNKTISPKDHIESSYTADPAEAVAITLPPKKEKSFFSSINPDAIAAVEDGSPASIRQAATLLRRDSASYTENEKILLNVAKSLMQILWPSEVFTFEISSSVEANPYTGAIDSSRQGIYDMSTGNEDFLALVLPSLVLVTSETRDDYYSASEQALDSALKLKENSVLANYLRGVLCRRQKKYSSAVTYFKRAGENAVSCIEIQYALADCYYKDGENEKALENATKILDENSLYRPALKLCAEICFSMGKMEECEQYVVRVLQQEPENSYYVLFRARILIQKGDYIRAASLLDVYGRTDPSNRDYLVLRSKVQKDWNRNITAASSTIEKALSLYPDDEEIVLLASSIAAETGGTVGGMSAIELADKILATDPSNRTALEIQVNELVRKKRWSEAYKASSTLQSLKEPSESSIYTHIDICLSAQKKDEAWNLASSLYNRNQKDENILQSYIKVLVATDRRSEAQRLITQNLTSSSAKMKSFLYYERSFLATAEDAVLVDLRSSLTANPRNKDALFRLYQIYYNKKEYRKAQYYLKQVVALSPVDENLLRLNSELESLLAN